MFFKNKNILVIGMGKSGIAAAEVLINMGCNITICDKRENKEFENIIDEKFNESVKVITGGYPQVDNKKFDLIIPSPGVPLDISPIKKALEYNIPIWSEIELAYRMMNGKLIAVTGTNGKTTTTTLIGKMLLDDKKNTIIGGNIGKPLVKEIKNTSENDFVVVEVSSFQLETIQKFRPKVAVLLNLTPDHLDRHKSIENYYYCKKNIFKNQIKEDYAVLNYDDPEVRKIADSINSKVIFFSQKTKLNQGVFINGNYLIANFCDKENIICSRDNITLRGDHNLENCLAAVSAGLLLGLKKESIAKTLNTFSGVDHRLEDVETINGITFINDSKGTNPDASIKALKAYSDKSIILIAGGMDKGNDFSQFASNIKSNVKGIVLLGETAEKISNNIKELGFNNYYLVKDLNEAVLKSWDIAEEGDVVLLSPACASWDMFRSFEERGNIFKEIVRSLGG